MAEMFGAVASGVGIASFAVQIVDSGMKLNELWNAIKDAPEEIKWLKEDIDSINTILQELDAQQALTTCTPSATKVCYAACRRTAETLENVVTELENTISRKKRRGSLKVVLKKEILASHKTRLSEAKASLSLALQMQNS